MTKIAKYWEVGVENCYFCNVFLYFSIFSHITPFILSYISYKQCYSFVTFILNIKAQITHFSAKMKKNSFPNSSHFKEQQNML